MCAVFMVRDFASIMLYSLRHAFHYPFKSPIVIGCPTNFFVDY